MLQSNVLAFTVTEIMTSKIAFNTPYKLAMVVAITVPIFSSLSYNSEKQTNPNISRMQDCC